MKIMNCIKNCNLSGRNERKIQCGGMCGKIYHLKCVGLKELDLNYITESRNVFYICEECVDFKNAVLKNMELINSYIKENKKVFDEHSINLNKIAESIKNFEDSKIELINEVKKVNLEECKNQLIEEVKRENCSAKIEVIKEIKKVKNNEVTYAGICKMNIPPIVVKPKKDQNVIQTKKDLENNIDPTNVNIKNIKPKYNGIIEIISENSEEREKIKDVVREKLGESYEIDILNLRKPKLFIHKMRINRNSTEVIEKIKKQNEYLKDSDIKIIKIIEKKVRNNVYYNLIAEIDRESYHKVMNNGKIIIGWDSCLVFDGTYVRRCYKCLGFNHTSDKCTNTEVCANCLKNHKTENCNEEHIEKCTNCDKANKVLGVGVSVNHSVFSRNCPMYVEKLRLEKQRVLY